MAKTLPLNTFTIRCFNPTRDLYGYIECRFAQNTLSETTIRNLHRKRDDEHPCPFIWGSPPPRATYMSAGLEESPVRSSRTRRFSFGASNFLT